MRAFIRTGCALLVMATAYCLASQVELAAPPLLLAHEVRMTKDMWGPWTRAAHRPLVSRECPE